MALETDVAFGILETNITLDEYFTRRLGQSPQSTKSVKINWLKNHENLPILKNILIEVLNHNFALVNNLQRFRPPHPTPTPLWQEISS